MADVLNDTLSVARSVPCSDLAAPYWEATRRKQLRLQYCTVSGRYQHYPRPVSLFTGKRRDLEWREVSGRGAVFSYTIARRGTPPFRGSEPYAVVSVTLDAGVNVIANMVRCPVDAMRVGLRVEPYWHPLGDGTHLLMFQPERDPA